jgi:hypothetical protein
MDFEEILMRGAARQVGEKRWGRAILSAAVALVVAVTGAGAKLGADAYTAHESRVTATAKLEAESKALVAQRLSAERQAICHDMFGFVGDDTPNKQIDAQTQARIGGVVAAGLQSCALLPAPANSGQPLKALPAPAERPS